MMSSLLDRSAVEPLHIQLKRALLVEIRERSLRPGDRLPSEQDLEERYGISRTTIRQAVASLASDGVVKKIQGKGTFVTDQEVSHVPRLTSFTENMLAQGHVPSTKLLESRMAPPPLAPSLNLHQDDPGAECRFLRRLLLADDRPIGVAETWLPLAVLGSHNHLLDESSLGNQSLYALLAAPPIGLKLHHGTEVVYASLVDGQLAALLGCTEGSPTLVAERTSYTIDDQVAEFTRMYFAGNRYVYRIDLGL
jgi:GntR family transcriptional regulator